MPFGKLERSYGITKYGASRFKVHLSETTLRELFDTV